MYSCFLFNVISTIAVTDKNRSHNGVGTLYEGNCSLVSSLDAFLHVVINVLGVTVLGARSYFMQCHAMSFVTDQT